MSFLPALCAVQIPVTSQTFDRSIFIAYTAPRVNILISVLGDTRRLSLAHPDGFLGRAEGWRSR